MGNCEWSNSGNVRHIIRRTHHAQHTSIRWLGELMMLITMGRPEDIQQGIAATGAIRVENKKRTVANIPEAHGTTRKSPTERRPGNPVEEGTGRLRSPTEGDPEGRQRGDLPRTTRDFLELTAAHLHGHGSTEIGGRRREHGYHRGGRDHVFLRVHGQLKNVDQDAYLQLIYKIGHSLERPIARLGLARGEMVESREQVPESFHVPEGFLSWMTLDSEPTKAVPRRVRLAI